MVVRIGQNAHARQQTFFRQWREYRGLSQDALAERLGTNKSAVSKMENGHVLYNQSSLEAWAHALQCTPSDLISRDPNQPPPIPIFDLPKGDAERVHQFIEALRVTRVDLEGNPSPELPDTPRLPGIVKSRIRRKAAS